MTGRLKFLFISAILSSLLFSAGAQDNYKIMDWKTEATLRTYLLQSMHLLYDCRREELADHLQTEKDVSDYREECRQKYIRLIGEMPARTPLNPMVTSITAYEGYTRENVIYESRPGHHVTSNLYLPEGKGPFPAALIFCGHEMTSKATESYQKTAILFTMNGFAVLVVDPISQGERVQFTDASGVRILRGSTTEHTLLNAGANLVGTSIVAWELYDNIRSLDYLISRPEVDPERIGCLGNSGGGAQTAYFIGFDERIRVAAPCSNIASRERNYELTGTGDGCQQIPYEGREQLEISDFLVMFAPKPLLILAGRYDFVDYTGTLEAYRETIEVYKAFGLGEQLALYTCDDGHGISKPKREAAVAWFRQWLCGDTAKVREGDIVAHNEETTFCTSTGQVNSYYTEEMDVQDYSLTVAKNLADERLNFMANTPDEKVLEQLSTMISLKDAEYSVNAETLKSEQVEGYIIDRLILRREGEVPLPCLQYMPVRSSSADTIIIWLDARGKASVASDQSLMAQQMKSGNVLLIADLRGMGETAEGPEANDWKYYNSEYHNAIISLHIGKPLPGQRVEDIMTIMKYLSGYKMLSSLPVKIKASGAAGPVAIFAAVLNHRIKNIEIQGSVSSYMEILQRPMEKEWYSYVVPDLLRYFDLPDLVAMRTDLTVSYTDH